MDPSIEKFLRYWDAYRDTFGVCHSNDSAYRVKERVETLNHTMDSQRAAAGLPPEVSPMPIATR